MVLAATVMLACLTHTFTVVAFEGTVPTLSYSSSIHTFRPLIEFGFDFTNRLWGIWIMVFFEVWLQASYSNINEINE